jgi:hypothetical protein
MKNDVQHPEPTRAWSWPSQASASAELHRPRRSRAERVTGPAVSRLARPALAPAAGSEGWSRYAPVERRSGR